MYAATEFCKYMAQTVLCNSSHRGWSNFHCHHQCLKYSLLLRLFQHLLLLLFSPLAILTGFFVLIFGQVRYDKEQFPQDLDDKLIICLPHG